MGWVKPTSLVTGDCLVSFGPRAAPMNLMVGATTSELEFYAVRTTPTQFISGGLGLVTGEWQFLAVFFPLLSVGTPAVMFWRGTLSGGLIAAPPATSTRGSGGVSSLSSMRIGNSNATAPVSAFKGLIGSLQIVLLSGTQDYGVAISAALSVHGSTVLANRLVLPAFLGQEHKHLPRRSGGLNVQEQSADFYLGGPVPYASFTSQSGSSKLAEWLPATVSGAVYSDSRPPTEMPFHSRPMTGGRPSRGYRL